jgi:hypothetical protein
MLQTFQTKLKNIPLNNKFSSEMYLSEYGQFFGMLERRLFVQSHLKGGLLPILKKLIPGNLLP